MNHKKKIMAILGIVALVLLYLATLILAFVDHSDAQVYFKTALGASFFFPVIFYVIHRLSR